MASTAVVVNTFRDKMPSRNLTAESQISILRGLRYQNVTEVPAPLEEIPVCPSESVASPTGFEPVLPH
jgi:hypothetical protein